MVSRSKMDLYTYQPLDRATDEVRLAQFLSIDENTIRLHIDTYSLSKATQFAALSYEWGPRETSEIIVDSNKTFSIQKSLERGLRVLWNYWKQERAEMWTLFWTDALCIDQSNILERGHQGNLMGSIYRSAEAVVVWLGPADDDADGELAMAAIRLQRYLTGEEGMAEAVLALLERRYWSRLWIIQEILMAHSVYVLCGWSNISLQQLSAYLQEGRLQNYTGPASSIINDKMSQGQDVFEPFLTLGMAIFKYVDRDCTIVMDKVYGLLGLVNFRGKEPIRPDYTLSAEEVYELVSTYFNQDPKTTKSEAEYFARICRECMGLF